MKLPLEEAIKIGVIRSSSDIKLDNDAKKIFKEGILMEDANKNNQVKTTNLVNYGCYASSAVNSKKVVERENFSNYLFPPL